MEPVRPTLPLAMPRDSSHTVLLSSPYFAVERYQLEGPVVLSAAPGKSSVKVLVCLEGGAVVEYECSGAQPVTFTRGEAVVIPAGLSGVTVRPQWQAELLHMSLPSHPVSEPLTTLRSADTGSGTRTPHRHD